MPYRPSSVAGSLVVAVAVLVSAGCPSSPSKSTCQVESVEMIAPHQAAAPSPSIMLLPDARLDAVGDGFVLLGTDGANVLWAVVGRDGVIVGDEQSVPVPAHSSGPWFAVAGTNAPRDHVVIAFVAGAAGPAGDVELSTFSVQIDGTAPTLPVSSGRIPAAADVTMMSGRGGLHAGIAWAVPGKTTISARIVGGNGVAVGNDLAVASVEDFNCLRFSPGKGDLTLGYVDLSGTPPAYNFVATEIDAAGTLQPFFKLSIGAQPVESPGCVQLVPTDKGYGIAWHSVGVATYFSPYDSSSTHLQSYHVLYDVEARPVPVLGGLGWLGKNYAVVFARVEGAEVWPINAMGQKQGDLPVFPSAVGHTGALSTQPVGSVLYATYADYADKVNVGAGSRQWVKVSCP